MLPIYSSENSRYSNCSSIVQVFFIVIIGVKDLQCIYCKLQMFPLLQ